MGGSIPEMEILLAGGVTKPAKDLKVGDKVDTLHEHTLERGEHEVTYVRVIDAPLLSLDFSGKTFTCSAFDRFYSASKGDWIDAYELTKGDKVSQLGGGELELSETKNASNGEAVELTVEGAHTYICDGVLLHNKGGSPPPPPPVVVMPPPPPPPQIIQDVTDPSTYAHANDYLKRLRGQSDKIDEGRWLAGGSPGDLAVRHASTELRAAQNQARADEMGRSNTPFMPSPGSTDSWGSQTESGLEAGNKAVIEALTKDTGSASRDARLRVDDKFSSAAPLPGTNASPTDRLTAAQNALALAQAQKATETFSPDEYVDPSWADHDWYPVLEKWKDRSDEIKVSKADPKIIST